MARILGIDPGVTGGLALFVPAKPGEIDARDIPTVDGEIDTDALAALLDEWRPTEAVVERASSRPGQGVASTFKYGAAYGALKATCSVLRIPLRLVSAGVWKRYFALDKDKEKSRALALRLWPGAGRFARKKDHGRAEAALIARWHAERGTQASRAAA